MFVVAPIVFGLDKFAGVLTDDWTRYLAPEFNDVIPGSAATAMHIVGIVEIAAGLVVLATPRWGALLVAGWLAGIILNLLLLGGYGDIAMRDFGLLAGALVLNRLAVARTTADCKGAGPTVVRRDPWWARPGPSGRLAPCTSTSPPSRPASTSSRPAATS